MAAVPTILVRVKQAVEKKIASGSIISRSIFNFAYFMRKMAVKARKLLLIANLQYTARYLRIN